MRYTSRLPQSRNRRYWLVDTSTLPEGEVLRCFYLSTQQPSFRWLYDGTPYQSVRDSGPVLLDITHEDTVLQKYGNAWAGRVASVLMDTPELLDDLQTRLANRLLVETSAQGVGLFRFHEPAALHLLLGEGLLSLAQRFSLMGPSTCWYWPFAKHQDRVTYELCYSSDVTRIPEHKPFRFDAEVQKRLAGIRHFSRLLPVLGEALHNFELYALEKETTHLWQAIERYWSASLDANQPRKKVIDHLRFMLFNSHTLDQFVDRLNMKMENKSSLGAST
ncbi:DUF4123 domain-containing protein [Halomonas dongshanensis]|uniref:DUF4123 domain-containing protein n=1 Tax=Halomonas dongshanensis TaxID=2890835 RepID=A0ABT2EAI6_9GAMM|nr:DUF4123 domain-containing protein [Halomonas dongshanensis]MCS2608576.1 DUF4123 domain-containing protein [Halomonas dongshanensis]